jgi:aminopeptidase
MPDGEVDIAPLEDSVSGWVEATHPARIHDTVIEDLRLEFSGGRVSRSSASSGTDILRSALEHDDAAARIGEIGFGMNSGITTIQDFELFDTKIAGMLSVSMGQGHTPTGSQNNSPVHWTFLMDLRDGSEVKVDGAVVLKDGLPV